MLLGYHAWAQLTSLDNRSRLVFIRAMDSILLQNVSDLREQIGNHSMPLLCHPRHMPGVVFLSVSGHLANGHLANGHLTNGHLANGHLANGHLANICRGGHLANIQNFHLTSTCIL